MRALGVDVGSHSLKAVLVRSGWSGVSVLSALEIPLGGRSPKSALTEALVKLGASPDSVCVSLDRASALFRTVQLPFSDRRKIAKAAPFAAEEVLPVGLDKVRVGCLDALPSQGGQYLIPVMAVPRPHLEGRRAVRLEDDRPPRVQLDSVGVAEALLASSQAPARGEGVLLIDVGARKTTLDVVSRDGLWASRALRTGTSRMATDAAPHLPAGDGDHDRTFLQAFLGEGRAPDEARRAVLAVYDELAREAQQIVASARSAGAGVERLVVSGGGSSVRHLVQYLGEKLGLPAKELQVEELLGKSRTPARFAAAYGLALVACDREKLRVDFTDDPRPAYWNDPFAAGLLALGVLLASGVMAGRTAFRIRGLENQLVELGARTSTVLAGAGEDKAQGPLGPRIERMRQLLGAFRTSGRSPLKVMDALSEAVPSRGAVRFEHVLLEGRDVRVEATAESFVPAEDFEAALRAHAGFEEVALEQQTGQFRQQAGASSRFVVTARVKEDAFR
jgi:Tfp pilus assembly PilM family ATPase